MYGRRDYSPRARSPVPYSRPRYDDRYDDRRDFRDDYRRPPPPRDDYYRRRSRSRSFERRRRSRSPPRYREPLRPRRGPPPPDAPSPPPSKVLGVFGLSIHTRERDLEELFGRYGRISNVSIIQDRQTGKSRGFGFITFDSVDDAIKARAEMSGYVFNQREMRVDFSMTKRAHSPTPGRYMGSEERREDDYRRPERELSPAPRRD
ncbi:Transformer-2 protein alpha [Phlyctochytrium planicorne]|nr:Transformer-2 protein alpha [Phlyctochytrium planicorne]